MIEPGLYGVPGALTRAQVENFFIGTNKYVRNENKPTNIYAAPGGAPVLTIPKGGNMGRVVYINENLQWGKLDSGKWIYLEDSLSTTILTVPPPNGITDAIGREVAKVAEFSVNKIIIPIVIGVGVLLVVQSLGNNYIRAKVAA